MKKLILAILIALLLLTSCSDYNIYKEEINICRVGNIYFDTSDDYLIRTSLSKPDYKEKLRLRAYGRPDENSEAFIEIKKKFKGGRSR